MASTYDVLIYLICVIGTLSFCYYLLYEWNENKKNFIKVEELGNTCNEQTPYVLYKYYRESSSSSSSTFFNPYPKQQDLSLTDDDLFAFSFDSKEKDVLASESVENNPSCSIQLDHGVIQHKTTETNEDLSKTQFYNDLSEIMLTENDVTSEKNNHLLKLTSEDDADNLKVGVYSHNILSPTKEEANPTIIEFPSQHSLHRIKENIKDQFLGKEKFMPNFVIGPDILQGFMFELMTYINKNYKNFKRGIVQIIDGKSVFIIYNSDSGDLSLEVKYSSSQKSINLSLMLNRQESDGNYLLGNGKKSFITITANLDYLQKLLMEKKNTRHLDMNGSKVSGITEIISQEENTLQMMEYKESRLQECLTSQDKMTIPESNVKQVDKYMCNLYLDDDISFNSSDNKNFSFCFQKDVLRPCDSLKFTKSGDLGSKNLVGTEPNHSLEVDLFNFKGKQVAENIKGCISPEDAVLETLKMVYDFLNRAKEDPQIQDKLLKLFYNYKKNDISKDLGLEESTDSDFISNSSSNNLDFDYSYMLLSVNSNFYDTVPYCGWSSDFNEFKLDWHEKENGFFDSKNPLRETEMDFDLFRSPLKDNLPHDHE